MCGNVALISVNQGVAGWQVRRDWLRDALILDTVRGADSTGLAFVKHTAMKEPDYMKWALAGPEFVEMSPYKTVLSSPEKYAVLMGHNRAATRGAVTKHNAHPFTYGGITLCHNGTLRTRNGVDSTMIVDSEAVCKAFSEKGPIETLEKLQGAYALQWYDSDNQTYNIARNSERPLSFMFTEDNKICMVASDSWLLRVLANKHKLKIAGNKIWDLNPGHLVTFHFEETTLHEYTSEQFSINKGSTYTQNFTKGGTCAKETPKNKGDINTAMFLGNLGEKRRARYIKRLTEVGLSLGQTVSLVDCGFVSYKEDGTKGVGMVEGIIPLDKDLWVCGVAHKVSHFPGLESKETKLVGDIIGCAKRDKVTEVVLNALRIVPEVPAVNDMYEGPDKTIISGIELSKLCEDGCSVCNLSIDIILDGFYLEWDGDKPICPDCTCFQPED